jgi:hypothetical protein
MAESVPPGFSCNTYDALNVYDVMNRTLAETARWRAPFVGLSRISGFRLMTATWTALVMAWVAVSVPAATGGVSSSRVFNIREFGAAGDRTTLDTPAIQKAIEACATAGGGQVLFPPGQYQSGTLHLRSQVTLFFEAGARLVGTTNLNLYQAPKLPDFMPEAKWGKWHRALILGDGLQDIALAGPGVIDGNKVFDPTGEERMRGPHTIVLINCRQVLIRDVSIVDSANYAAFLQISDQVEIRNVKITGGWDGIHFRGSPERPCRDIRIIGCQFYTGDDAIAGRYWQNTLITDCILNSSCNAVRVIGPAQHLIIQNCLIYGPGVEPHRSSKRTNLLAGINLQPGAWDATRGSLDDVLISDITMHNVTTPFHFSIKPGNTAGNIRVNRVTATGVYRAAASVESWAETPLTNVVFRDVTIEYTGGGTLEQARATVKSPGVDARPLPAWGFYARNVQNLEFDNVRLRCEKDDLRPVLICDRVARLTLEDFKFTHTAEAPDILSLNDVAQVQVRGTDLATVEPRCTELKLVVADADGRFVAGRPFSAQATVENGEAAGLGRVVLRIAGQPAIRWVWLRSNEKKEVVFKGLLAPAAGTHPVQCGDQTRNLRVEP